jgi:hypothetical protein
MDPIESGPIIRAAMTIKEAEDQAAKLTKRLTDELGAFARKLGVVAGLRVIRPSEESTPMAINNYAKDIEADLIVVGTRVRSGFEKWLLGSVAEEWSVMPRWMCSLFPLHRCRCLSVHMQGLESVGCWRIKWLLGILRPTPADPI